MSLAFSVEGFLFYVHLHGNDKFKVNRTLFILDFGTTVVFLLAVESDRFASVADPDLRIKWGAATPPGPSPRSASVPHLWAFRELIYWACREVGFCTMVSFFMALNLGKTPQNMWSSRNLFFLYMYWLYLFFMHLCGRIICFRYFAKKNQLNEPLLGSDSDDEKEND